MAASTFVPEIINNYNVYNQGNKLIGVSGTVTLPDFSPITEAINGAGILGEYEASIIGHYSSMEQVVPFRILDEDIFSLMDPRSPVDLTFRASEQMTDKATGGIEYRPIRIVERGRFKSFSGGTLDQGKQMGASVTFELLYILIEVDGKRMLEYDKLNAVFVVNEKDLLEDVRKYT